MNDCEDFWAGDFGNKYTARNAGEALINSNVDFFAKALVKARNPESIMEIGCNNGMNLLALEYLYPSVNLYGVDINAKSLVELEANFEARDLPVPITRKSPASEFMTEEKYDLVLTKGLLIHVEPSDLPAVYENIYMMAGRYILLAEYYNPTPMEIPYRGFTNRLWKRDFAGEMMDRFPLKLIDSGFTYHRGEFPQDDINWFLMERA